MEWGYKSVGKLLHLACTKSQVQSPAPCRLGVVAHAQLTQEIEAGKARSFLAVSKFEASLGSMKRCPLQKREVEKRRKEGSKGREGREIKKTNIEKQSGISDQTLKTAFIYLSVCLFFCLPQFLCALPRRDGYEFFVGQWTGTELHFTALINIQVRNICPTKHGVEKGNLSFGEVRSFPGAGVQNLLTPASLAMALVNCHMLSIQACFLGLTQYQKFEIKIPFTSFTVFLLSPPWTSMTSIACAYLIDMAKSRCYFLKQSCKPIE